MDRKVVIGYDFEGFNEWEGSRVDDDVVASGGDVAVVTFASGGIWLFSESLGDGANVGPSTLCGAVGWECRMALR